MNKNDQREIRKVLNTARIEPYYAAAVLAPMLRSCSNRDLPVLMDVMDSNGLRAYMEVVNGCYVEGVATRRNGARYGSFGVARPTLGRNPPALQRPPQVPILFERLRPVWLHGLPQHQP
jgi:hypothetical protein